MTTHLDPFVSDGVVAFDVIEVLLAVVTSHSEELVAQGAQPYRITGRTDGVDVGPLVCLRVVPVKQ
jgi:hypothetical protein